MLGMPIPVTVEEVISTPPVKEATEEAREEAVARDEVGEKMGESSKLGDLILQYLANLPDGTRLTDIENLKDSTWQWVSPASFK